jgi:ABC-2 type transport system permease protein
MKKFLVLVKKEIKELLTLQMILPMIAMVVIFSFIGNLLSKETAKISAPQTAWVLDQDKTDSSAKAIEILGQVNFNPDVLKDMEINQAIDEVKKNKGPFLRVLPSGFEQGIKGFTLEQVPVYKIITSFSIISSVKFNAADAAVLAINNYFSNQWIQEKNVNIQPDLLKNPVQKNEFVIINQREANLTLASVTGFINQQTYFIPIIIFIVIIIAAQMVAMAMANEKENKTLETLLSSPVGRKTIVFAKLIGAGTVALLSAGFYMIGFRSYLSGLTGSMAKNPASGQITEMLRDLGIVFGPVEYILLGASLFLGILVALAMAMILGSMTESSKNIQSIITPLMLLVLIPYFLTLFFDIHAISPIARFLLYAIPFTHTFLAVQNLMAHDYLFVIFGIIYQLIVFIIFVALAAKIFSSDKILTLKVSFKRKKKFQTN